MTASQGERRPLTLTLSRHGVRLRRATRQGRGDFAIILGTFRGIQVQYMYPSRVSAWV